MSLKIFIVEDNHAYAKMLTYRLNKSGFYNITILESGEECIRLIDQKPDIVLLDFSLKGLNGLDTLGLIKKESPRTDVIVLTALDNKKLARECLEAGALDYLVKKEESLLQIIKLIEKNRKKKSGKNVILVTLVIVLIVIITAFFLL